MRKITLMAVALALVLCVGYVVAEGLLVPNTAGDNLGRSDKAFGNVYATGVSNATTKIYATNVVVMAGGELELLATATVNVGCEAGYSGVVTNASASITNLVAYYNGIVTNVTVNP